MPLLASFKPFELLTLVAGPQISFLINQKDVFRSGNLTIDQKQVFKDDNSRRNVLCILAGFDINVDYMVLGARAGWDIQNNNGDGTSFFYLYVPPGKYFAQFTVRIGGANTCVAHKGIYSGCSAVYRTGNRFADRFEVITIGR